MKRTHNFSEGSTSKDEKGQGIGSNQESSKKPRLESNSDSTQDSGEQSRFTRSSSVSSSNTIAELRQEREELLNRLSHAEDNDLPSQSELREELIRFDEKWGDLTDNEVLPSDSSDDSDDSDGDGNHPQYDSGFGSPHEDEAEPITNPQGNSNQNTNNSVENSWAFIIFCAISDALNNAEEYL